MPLTKSSLAERALAFGDICAMSQVCSSQFGVALVGHAFVLRRPLSKVNVRKCAICGNDVYMHHTSEVEQSQLQTILDLRRATRARPRAP